jgi:hypothetical protein
MEVHMSRLSKRAVVAGVGAVIVAVLGLALAILVPSTETGAQQKEKDGLTTNLGV